MKKVDDGPIASSNVRKVEETTKFQKKQLNMAMPMAVARTSSGKISETITQRMAPRLKAKEIM